MPASSVRRAAARASRLLADLAGRGTPYRARMPERMRRAAREQTRRVAGDVIEPRRVLVGGRLVPVVIHEGTGRPIKDVTPSGLRTTRSLRDR